MDDVHVAALLEEIRGQYKSMHEGIGAQVAGLGVKLDAHIVETKVRFDRVEGALLDLNGRVGRLEGVVTTLDGRVKNLEADMHLVKDQVGRNGGATPEKKRGKKSKK